MFAVNTFHLIQTLKKKKERKKGILSMSISLSTHGNHLMPLDRYTCLLPVHSPCTYVGPPTPVIPKKNKGGRLTHPHPCGMCSSICYKNDWIHI